MSCMRFTSTCTPCASSTSPIACAISSVAPCLLADATRTVVATPPFGVEVSVGGIGSTGIGGPPGRRRGFPAVLGGLLEQALRDRVADQLSTAREPQLLHDVSAVRLGRAHRDVELL